MGLDSLYVREVIFCAYASVGVHVRACVHACVYAYLRACVYAYVYVWVWVYICTSTT